MKNIKLTASSAKERHAAEQEVMRLYSTYLFCVSSVRGLFTYPGISPISTEAPKHCVLQGVLSGHSLYIAYCHGLL